MSLAPITLTTDKSTAVIDNPHRSLRQDESGLSITVTVLNEDNTAYDLTGKNLVFCENKQNNKIIIDDGKGDNSGKFNRNSDNDAKGVFTYVLQEDVYAASGKAWFEITDGTTVDSTKNFYFDVEKDTSVNIINNDYVGSLKALETAIAGAQSKVASDLADMEAQITKQIADTKTANEEEITQAVKNLTDQTTAALSNVDEYTQKLATLQSQWDSELQSIKNKAGADTDSAVKAINDRYTNDFAKLQSDFANWQTSTTQNYQKQVDDILAQIQQTGTNVADVKKQVDDTVAKMQTLSQQFSSINFTQFLKPSALDNYYTKAEVDSKTSGTIVTAYNIASKTPTLVTDSYTNKWLVDQLVLPQFADQINQLKGRRSVDAPDFDTLTDTGVYYISNPQNGKNAPSDDNWGTLSVFNGNSQRIAQLYVGDNGSTFMRIRGVYNSTTWTSWDQIAWKSDISSLQSAISNGLAGKADKSQVNVDGNLFSSPGSVNSWADLQADGSKNVLKSVRTEGQATDFNTGNWDAGILFGGNDTKALISVDYEGHQARVSGGNDTATWHEDIAWKSDIINLSNQINALQNAKPDLSGYETTTDAKTLADRITALENRPTTQIVPISQADYDKLATKDPNTLYEITE